MESYERMQLRVLGVFRSNKLLFSFISYVNIEQVQVIFEVTALSRACYSFM